MDKPEHAFEEFTKISRFNRQIILTEKLDGTNACVYVSDAGDRVFAASRSRWITPDDDNFGFAKWVAAHHDELLTLGPGYHFGEWWGLGIQRGYGMREKIFSLFSTARWTESRPSCCSVVPVLASGLMCEVDVPGVLASLGINGSVAAPGFMKPEGIVVFHSHSGQLFKMTLDKNDAHKGAS